MTKYPLNESDKKLIPLALEVLEKNFDDGIYNHTVGCALICKNGNIYKGVNCDGIHGACAEYVTMGIAISAGERDFETIEDTVMQLETRLEELAAEIEANAADYVKVAALMAEQEELEAKLEALVQREIENLEDALAALDELIQAKLEELETEEEQIELNILKEQTSAPKLTKEQILFALDKFRKLDLTIEVNKERLIDSLVKCVLLYDDKLVITFNFKNEPVTVPTSEEFDAIEKSSDTRAFASPKKR